MKLENLYFSVCLDSPTKLERFLSMKEFHLSETHNVQNQANKCFWWCFQQVKARHELRFFELTLSSRKRNSGLRSSFLGLSKV